MAISDQAALQSAIDAKQGAALYQQQAAKLNVYLSAKSVNAATDSGLPLELRQRLQAFITKLDWITELGSGISALVPTPSQMNGGGWTPVDPRNPGQSIPQQKVYSTARTPRRKASSMQRGSRRRPHCPTARRRPSSRIARATS